MDMEKIGNNILKAFIMLAKLVGVVGGLFLGLFLIALILGIIFGLVTGGSIVVDTATNATLVAIQGNFSSVMGSVMTGAGTAGTLIVVAIVLIVFGGLVIFGYQQYKKAKKQQGGMGGY